MAGIQEVRAALANQITTYTGLATVTYMPDQITPPMAAILPGSPYVKYGITLGDPMLNAPMGQRLPVPTELQLRIGVWVSRAPSAERAQAAVDAYLGLEPNAGSLSIPLAIVQDPTLGGVVEWCEAVNVVAYGNDDVAGQTYFRGMLAVTVDVVQDLGA